MVFHCDLCDDLRKTAQKKPNFMMSLIQICMLERTDFFPFILFICVSILFFLSKIIVDGVRGISYRGDAALDDFSFQKGTCNQTGIYRTQERMS